MVVIIYLGCIWRDCYGLLRGCPDVQILMRVHFSSLVQSAYLALLLRYPCTTRTNPRNLNNRIFLTLFRAFDFEITLHVALLVFASWFNLLPR